MEIDKYELQLQEYTEALQKCQQEQGLQSCFECEQVLECQTRIDYVKAVYQSMNKGEGGGFEF